MTITNNLNWLNYAYIRKKSNQFENISTPPPDEIFWAAGNPPEGVLKYIDFFFRYMLYLMLIIEVM